MITGSTQYPAEALSETLGIEHTLCSRLELINGRFTGRLERRCYGQHKVAVAEEFAEIHRVDLEK